MPATAQGSGIPFAVDNVTPATSPLTETRLHSMLRNQLGDLESCHDYHRSVITRIDYQPLLAAVYTAFSEHRPLVLSPDAVWITITQGVAHHMTIHGERLRSRFVAHAGRVELVFACDGWAEGSPENPWAEAFASWAGQIRDHVGATLHDALLCDFSTSGPVERAASQVVMMDIFERYFEYVLLCICGIPTITLEGTTDDWIRLRNKVEALHPFELDWWLEHLTPICDQFVRASKGDVDLDHWRAICKRSEAYGGDIINGWIAKLFPYLRSFPNGPCRQRNQIFETGAGFQTSRAPSGLSSVPFRWIDLRSNRSRPMQAIGGLVGVTQDADTLALNPIVGWAVRKVPAADVLLDRLAAEHTTFPGADIYSHDERGYSSGMDFPGEFNRFYHRTNGAELGVHDGVPAVRIVPREAIEPLEWGEVQDGRGGSYGPHGRIWHRFAILADGRWLAINLDLNLWNAPYRKDPALFKRADELGHERFRPICVCTDSARKKPGRNPVVAFSFGELLKRLLDNGGHPYWEPANELAYGDAELYTRKE